METVETPTFFPYKLSMEDIEILKLVDKGLYVSSIARELGVSKAKISKKLKKFVKWGLVRKINSNPAFFELTDLGRYHLSNYVSDVTARPLAVTVHNFRVVLPVVSIDVSRLPVGRVSGLRGGEQVSWRDGEFVFQLNNDRSVTIIFPNFEVNPGNLIGELIRHYTYYLVLAVLVLREKYGIRVDVSNVRITNQEFHNWLPDFLRNIIQKEKHYDMNKPANSILGYTDILASLWFDLSPDFGIETKDLDYEALFASMPFLMFYLFNYIKEYNKSVAVYTEQIKKHLSVLESMDQTLKKISDYFERRPGLFSRLVFHMKRFFGKFRRDNQFGSC